MSRRKRLTVEDIKDLIENRISRNKERTMHVLYELGKLNVQVEEECVRLMELIDNDEFKQTPGGKKLSKILGDDRLNEKGLLLMESLLYNIEYELKTITDELQVLAEKVKLVKDVDTVIKAEHIELFEDSEM